ncbi:MAG: GtrA family protein [Pseudomonadota bacterium]
MKNRLDFLPPVMRFALVGAFAYVVDAATLLILNEVMHVVPARLIAFGVAVTTTFFLNMWLTFEGLLDQSLLKSYLKYVSANSVGGVINVVVSTALLLQNFPLISTPVIAVAFGSLSGLAANYTLSKRFIFRTKKQDD